METIKNKAYIVTTETGEQKEIFDGRYACICAMVLAKEGNEVYVLANQRGPGCPNEVGKWNMPCGYMDGGSAAENCSREVYEETGVKIPPEQFEFVYIDDITESNVTLHYRTIFEDGRQELAPLETIKTLGGEPDEVIQAKWINIKDAKNYDWAFEHEQVIEKYSKNL